MHKKFLNKFAALALLGNVALLSLGACAHEGPMERGGKHVDNAADKAKHETKKALD